MFVRENEKDLVFEHIYKSRTYLRVCVAFHILFLLQIISYFALKKDFDIIMINAIFSASLQAIGILLIVGFFLGIFNFVCLVLAFINLGRIKRAGEFLEDESFDAIMGKASVLRPLLIINIILGLFYPLSVITTILIIFGHLLFERDIKNLEKDED